MERTLLQEQKVYDNGDGTMTIEGFDYNLMEPIVAIINVKDADRFVEESGMLLIPHSPET